MFDDQNLRFDGCSQCVKLGEYKEYDLTVCGDMFYIISPVEQFSLRIEDVREHRVLPQWTTVGTPGHPELPKILGYTIYLYNHYCVHINSPDYILKPSDYLDMDICNLSHEDSFVSTWMG